MNKKFYTPWELMSLANDHACSAQYLLQHSERFGSSRKGSCDSLTSICSLMIIAFELTLRAYLSRQCTTHNSCRNLLELLELSQDLGLSNENQQLLRKLSRQQAMRKAIDHGLWQNREQLQGFCHEIIQFFERLQQILPIELHNDYQ